MLNVETTLDL